MNPIGRRLPFVVLIVSLASAGRIAAQQPARGLAPRLAAEVLATSDDELNSTFTPDGQTVYFSKDLGGRFGVIMVSRQRGGKWSSPEVVTFSGQYSDYDPFIAPDGSRLFWISKRPVAGNPKEDYDIWMVERQDRGWGAPIHLDAPVNTDAEEFYPTVAANGNLYFSSTRPGGAGRGDIYRSKLKEGRYGEPENLGDSLNSPQHDGDPFIAPDESFIVFASYGRPDGVGDGDLYLSLNANGKWGPARPLGQGINSVAREYCPVVSPDRAWLYFTSLRGFIDDPLSKPLTSSELRRRKAEVLNGTGNVWRIPVAALPLPREERTAGAH